MYEDAFFSIFSFKFRHSWTLHFHYYYSLNVYVCICILYLFSKSNVGIDEVFFSITIRKLKCATKRILPKITSLTKVIVSFFSWFIRPFSIDVVSNWLINLLDMSGRETFHAKISVGSSGFLSGILSQNKSMHLTVFFMFWHFFH